MRRVPGVLLFAFLAGAVPGAVAGVYAASGSRDTTTPAASAPFRITPTKVDAQALPPTTNRAASTAPAQVGDPFVARSDNAVQRRVFRRTLARGVAAARREGAEGGQAEAAIWIQGWPRPVVAGGSVRMRLWSTAKPPTALAVMAAARGAGKRPLTGLRDWMTAAFERSENCPEREMVLYLQSLSGNDARTAARQFRRVLSRAGINDAYVPTGLYPPDGTACLNASERLGPLPYPLSSNALQFGTAEWTIRDAVWFAYALATGVYGPDGERVLALMRKPKARSREQSSPNDYTVPSLGWGAGDAFRGWDPAYKAGWGGSRRAAFMVEQYVVLDVGGHKIAIAAAYHPRQQPTLDDPGQGNAWRALEDIFRPLRAAIEREYPNPQEHTPTKP